MMQRAARRQDATRSPLRGRYLVRDRAANLMLGAVDAVLSRAVRPGSPAEQALPRSVLLSIGGHIGDAVLATAALRMLRDALPTVEIGVVAASWARMVFDRHPAVRRFHELDHWKLDRRPGGLLRKLRRYHATAGAAVREIKAARYDAAVDLYPYFPNAAAVLWRAEVPIRIGFESGGLGPLYTRAIPWRERPGGWHTVDQHRALVAELPGINVAALAGPARYDLPAPHGSGLPGVLPSAYVVIHPGAGNSQKIWSADGWRNVVRELAGRRVPMIFTGQGAHEAALVGSIIAGVPGCLDLCGTLDWDAFRQVVAGARVLAGADSVAAHLAAASEVPVVVLAADVTDMRQWRPLGSHVTVLELPTPARVVAAIAAGLEEQRARPACAGSAPPASVTGD